MESVIRFITIKYSLFLGETRMSSTDKGTEFERTVCEILYQTNPYSISHYIGGSDRGKDILLQYKIGTQL